MGTQDTLIVKGAGDGNEKYAEVMSRVIDGLRGDAFIVAKELTVEKLWDPGDEFQISGCGAFIKAIKENVFPQTTHEAKELFRQYTPQRCTCKAEQRIHARLCCTTCPHLEATQ